jgi:uncharacterized protein
MLPSPSVATVALLLLSACSSLAGAPALPSPTVVIETPRGGHSFRVELAQTNPERARGLMYRERLADDDGMLFLFDDMRVQSFWMKNTKLPLDMIFISDAGLIVGIVENAEPMTLSPRTVGKPSQYVLEVIAGTCRRLGIEAGQPVRFLGVPGHPKRAPAGPVR